MAVSGHCGSPQAALRMIPRAMGARERGRFVWCNRGQTTLQGHAIPLYFSRLACTFPFSLIKPHAAFDARSSHSFVHESCYLDRLKLLRREDLKISLSRHLVECKSLHISGLLPFSLLIARSFSSAQVSSLDEFKETDLKRNNELEEENLASDATSESLTKESQSLRELVDSKEFELQSLRSALRALERDNGMLQERYERACDELKQLKLDKGTSRVSEPASSLSPLNVVTVEVKQSREDVHAGILAGAEENSCSIVTDEVSSISSSALLEVGAIAAAETAARRSDHVDGEFRSGLVDRIISVDRDRIISVDRDNRKINGGMDLEPPATHDLKEPTKASRLVKSSMEEKKASSLSPLESEESHPWPEWTAFLGHLTKNNYFSSDVEDDSIEADGVAGIDGGVKKATMDFARDRDDIFEAFSKTDLKVLASFGCPSTDRKVVNAGKRLRAYFEVSESSVCKPCSLKSTCARAYSESGAGTAATIDVIRLLLVFAFNVGAPLDMKLSLPRPVEAAIASLLVQAVELSKVPRDPNLPRPEAKEFFAVSTVKKRPPLEVRSMSRSANEQIEMKPGDWRCSECHYVNFSRNRHCRECAASRPPQELRPGDWECPKCQYVNYSKNMQCRECNAERPRGPSSRTHLGRSFDVRQGSRERPAFGNREREDRRDSFGNRGRDDRRDSFDNREREDRRDSFGNRGRDDRRDSFGYRERDDRRDSFGDFSRSAGSARPKHQEWKPNVSKPKRKSGHDIDDDASDSDESVDMEDTDSELDDLELNIGDLDEDLDDLDVSDDEIDDTSSRRNTKARKSSRNESDKDDFWEDLDERPKGRSYTRGGMSSTFDNRSSSGNFSRSSDFSSRGRTSRGGRGGGGGGGRSRGRGRGRGRGDDSGYRR